MDIELIGVLQDGGPRGANLPADPRQELTFIFGADVLLSLDVYHENGEPLDTTGWEFFWTIKKRRKNGFQPFIRQGTPVPYKKSNRVEFYLTGAETEGIKPGKYVYDIWAEVPGGGAREPLVPFSALTVEPACYPADPGAITPNPGPPPGPATKQRVFNATLTGTKPGSIFTTPEDFLPASEAVYLNGQRLDAPACYTRSESGGPGTGFDTITFTFSVISSDTLLIDYTPK